MIIEAATKSKLDQMAVNPDASKSVHLPFVQMRTLPVKTRHSKAVKLVEVSSIGCSWLQCMRSSPNDAFAVQQHKHAVPLRTLFAVDNHKLTRFKNVHHNRQRRLPAFPQNLLTTRHGSVPRSASCARDERRKKKSPIQDTSKCMRRAPFLLKRVRNQSPTGLHLCTQRGAERWQACCMYSINRRIHKSGRSGRYLPGTCTQRHLRNHFRKPLNEKICFEVQPAADTDNQRLPVIRPAARQKTALGRVQPQAGADRTTLLGAMQHKPKHHSTHMTACVRVQKKHHSKSHDTAFTRCHAWARRHSIQTKSHEGQPDRHMSASMPMNELSLPALAVPAAPVSAPVAGTFVAASTAAAPRAARAKGASSTPSARGAFPEARGRGASPQLRIAAAGSNGGVVTRQSSPSGGASHPGAPVRLVVLQRRQRATGAACSSACAGGAVGRAGSELRLAAAERFAAPPGAVARFRGAGGRWAARRAVETAAQWTAAS